VYLKRYYVTDPFYVRVSRFYLVVLTSFRSPKAFTRILKYSYRDMKGFLIFVKILVNSCSKKIIKYDMKSEVALSFK
jgi:hypothetical protein